MAFAEPEPRRSENWQVILPPDLPGDAAKPLRDRKLLTAIAGLKEPAELARQPLAGLFPHLAEACVTSVVGAPLRDDEGVLTAAVIAAYLPCEARLYEACEARLHGRCARQYEPDHPCRLVELSHQADSTDTSQSSRHAQPEAIGCVAKLLQTAHSDLRTRSRSFRRPPAHPPMAAAVSVAVAGSPTTAAPPTGSNVDHLLEGDPLGLLVAREVSTIFAVTPHTVANWVTSGTLRAGRTAGGHLRFRRRDVLALYEGLSPAATP